MKGVPGVLLAACAVLATATPSSGAYPGEEAAAAWSAFQESLREAIQTIPDRTTPAELRRFRVLGRAEELAEDCPEYLVWSLRRIGRIVRLLQRRLPADDPAVAGLDALLDAVASEVRIHLEWREDDCATGDEGACRRASRTKSLLDSADAAARPLARLRLLARAYRGRPQPPAPAHPLAFHGSASFVVREPDGTVTHARGEGSAVVRFGGRAAVDLRFSQVDYWGFSRFENPPEVRLQADTLPSGAVIGGTLVLAGRWDPVQGWAPERTLRIQSAVLVVERFDLGKGIAGRFVAVARDEAGREVRVEEGWFEFPFRGTGEGTGPTTGGF